MDQERQLHGRFRRCSPGLWPLCLHGVPPAPEVRAFQRCGGGAGCWRGGACHASLWVFRCWHATTRASRPLLTVRGPTCDPDMSSVTELTPPGLVLSLGSPTDVSRARAAAPPPPPSSDRAGRPDTGRMPALGRPRTAAVAGRGAACHLRRPPVVQPPRAGDADR